MILSEIFILTKKNNFNIKQSIYYANKKGLSNSIYQENVEGIITLFNSFASWEAISRSRIKFY